MMAARATFSSAGFTLRLTGASKQQPNSSRRETMATATTYQASRKSNRGFASMDREKQKEIASKGGRAAHAQGRAHEFTADEARSAGRKGGEAVSRDREHMAQIGRAGGQARGRNRANGAQDTPNAE
jgi:general stress protein YciG